MKYDISVGLGIGVFAGMLGGGFAANCTRTPQQANVGADLNLDGVPDLVIEQRQGHKVPMYGVKIGDDITYLSASKIVERNPNSVIDYDGIESRLNRQ